MSFLNEMVYNYLKGFAFWKSWCAQISNIKWIFDIAIIYFELSKLYLIAERGKFYLNKFCPSPEICLES